MPSARGWRGLPSKVQVMAVTHAPQVAARAGQHLLISKDALDKGKRVATRVNALAADHRREEIARMLAGAEITAEARAAAERLLEGGLVGTPRMASKAKTAALPDVAKLTKAQAKVEHMRLALELEGHDRRYYQDDAPSVSDAEYDALRARFNAIEKRFPEFVSAESPSQKVGAAPSGRFRKVRHAVPMLSLDNAFSEEDVRDFVDRIARFLKLPRRQDRFLRRAQDRRAVDVAAL